MPFTASPPVWVAPVVPVVVARRYRVVEAYAAGGHRGIDLRAKSGVSVRSPCSGTVTFRGAVGGGPPTVTIDCGPLRATLQRVRSAVGVGTELAAGATIGMATDDAVDLSARLPDGRYRDPLPLLQRTRTSPPPVAVASRLPPRERRPSGLPSRAVNTPDPAAQAARPVRLPASALVSQRPLRSDELGASGAAGPRAAAAQAPDRPLLLAGGAALALVAAARFLAAWRRRPRSRGRSVGARIAGAGMTRAGPPPARR